MATAKVHPASFRDPAGFVFEADGRLFRQVNKSFADEYDMLMSSGLYDRLTKARLLIAHRESPDVIAEHSTWYKTVEPTPIPFLSYPAEWCFFQLKDAALATLEIARAAIGHGMVLKDATPYNIQFAEGKALHIDTLSFAKYDESAPWVAYNQFCRTFLFPLYIAHYTRSPVNKLMLGFAEGIPVSVTASLLPLKSRLNAGVWLHVHLQNRISSTRKTNLTPQFSRRKMINLLSHLSGEVEKLTPYSQESGWTNYYDPAVTANLYLDEKEKVIRTMVADLPAGNVLDIGCNQGHFSLLLAENGHNVVAMDLDESSINLLYQRNNSKVLPLVADVMNPTPASGFANLERKSLLERVRPDLVLALAIVHHLAIANNLPLPKLADFLACIAPTLIIEWVPREDVKVQQMLTTRHESFEDYTQYRFEEAFSRHFTISGKAETGTSGRYIYLMKKN